MLLYQLLWHAPVKWRRCQLIAVLRIVQWRHSEYGDCLETIWHVGFIGSLLLSPNFNRLLKLPRWARWRRLLHRPDWVLPVLLLLVVLGGMCEASVWHDHPNIVAGEDHRLT